MNAFRTTLSLCLLALNLSTVHATLINIVNGSFEAPAYNSGGWSYLATDGVSGGWTTNNNGHAGVARYGSPWITAAPDGLQAGFVESASGVCGSLSHSISVPKSGSYDLIFRAAGHPLNGASSLSVRIDNTVVGTWPASAFTPGMFGTYAARVSLSAGVHSLTFAATSTTGTVSTAIDRIILAGDKNAFTLDAGYLSERDIDVQYLVQVLQGVVNRDAPRLFLTKTTSSIADGAGNAYVNYLKSRKGFTFVELKSINDAVATFAALKRADGVTPLIKGLVKYPGSYYQNGVFNDKYYHYWIASNFAAQEDLLPVTQEILSNQKLGNATFWYQDNQLRSWKGNYTHGVLGSNGLSITPTFMPGVPAETTYYGRTVNLDLSVTPKLEVVISDLTPGGVWTMGLAMGSTLHTYQDRNYTRISGLTRQTKAGTFVVDLAASGLFDPSHGLANLFIIANTANTTVTLRSVRFLDANGRDPEVPLYLPPTNEFDSLPIKRDLTVSAPYADNEASACAWSMANQRRNCEGYSIGWFADAGYCLPGLDYAIARKSYLYFDRKKVFDTPTPNLDALLNSLERPSIVYGSLVGGEDWAMTKMGQFGSRTGTSAENWSFWQWIPLDDPTKPVLPEPARQVTNLENKVYVNFCWASSDVIRLTNGLMWGLWEDPQRGQFPMTWGINPLIMHYAPALAEFFAKTATPNDSFWYGVTGAGYTQPSLMSDADLALYAQDTRECIADLGGSAAVDYWDYAAHFPRVFDAMTASGGTAPPLKLICTSVHKTLWLDDGTPVVPPDPSVVGDGERFGDDPVAYASAIQASVEQKHTLNEPYFVMCVTRFSPSLGMKLRDLLPPNYVFVGMQDFIGLAQDAGALAVVPYTDSVGSGDSVKISVELHNVAGRTGGAGNVTWTLPPGWTSSPASWAHGTVPLGSNLRQVVTFTPPSGMKSGSVTITFKDSRFAWTKQVSLTTYPESFTVTDCPSTAGWTLSNGAGLAMDNGMIQVSPRLKLKRYDYLNGIRLQGSTGVNGVASFPIGWVDFDRGPVLNVNVPVDVTARSNISISDSVGGRKGVIDTEGRPNIYSPDLQALTGWTGSHYLTLNVNPSAMFGDYLDLRSAKICYSQTKPAPLVVNTGTTVVSTNGYVTLNGGTLLADPAQGSTAVTALNVSAGGTVVTANGFKLSVGQLSGVGTLTLNGTGTSNTGVNLIAGDNTAFSGKIILNTTWLWATGTSTLGAEPTSYLSDAITLNSSSLVFNGTIPANRGITILGPCQLFGSTLTVNSVISGTGNLTVMNCNLALNAATTLSGTFQMRNAVVDIGTDNALPWGAGKKNVIFVDKDPGARGSTLNLNGHLLNLNGLTQTAVIPSSCVDNQASHPATLVVGNDNVSSSLGAEIKNTAGLMNVTKVGSGVFTLTGINSYNGVTTVSNGTLALSGNGTLGNSSRIDVAAGAMLDVSGRTDGTLTLTAGQSLHLNGRFKGILQSNGAVAPGAETLTLESGSYTQASGGSLNVEVTGSNRSGQLVVPGTVSLDGTLKVALGGYVPQAADEFTVLTASSLTGKFVSVDLPPLPLGLVWSISYTATSVKLTVTAQYWDTNMEAAGAQGGSGTWTSGGGNWYDGGANITWPDNIPNTQAIFGPAESGSATVKVLGTVVTGGLLFSASSTPYTLTGGTLSMSNPSLSITANGAPVTINSAISGNGTLVKLGAGSVTLAGSNSYTGDTIVKGGTLLFSGNSSLCGTSNVTVDAGATFELAPSTSMVPISSISGSGAVNVSGAAFNSGVILTASSNSRFSGKINVGATVGGLYSVLSIATEESLGTDRDALTLGVRGSTSLSDYGAPLSISNHRITLGSGASTLTSTATDGDMVIKGGITGVGGLAIRSQTNHAIVIAGVNDYAGSTTIYTNTTTNSTLRLGEDNALPFGPKKGNLILTAWNSGSAKAKLDMGGYSLTVNGLTDAGNGGKVIDNSVAGSNATLTVGASNVSATFAGTITNTAGTVGLTKIGTGKQSLTNPCTFSGPTLVTAGVLALSGAGSLENSSTITVEAGATLDVSGRTDGTLTLGPGRKLVVNGTVRGLVQLKGATVVGSGTWTLK